MTRKAVFSCLLFLAALAWLTIPLAPAKDVEREKEALRAEAMDYARNLLTVCVQVEQGYYRSVSRGDLLYWALSALCEAARQPEPRDLKDEASKAQRSESALLELACRVREGLGRCEALEGSNALLVSCRGLARVLDPHSALVTEEDRKSLPWGDQPAGVGFVLADNVGVGPLKIGQVFPGTPAQKAGLQPGDEITHIDGLEIKGQTSAQVSLRLRREVVHAYSAADFPGIALSNRTPPEVPPIKVTVRRSGESSRVVVLPWQERRPECVLGVSRDEHNAWEYWADRKNKLAHVRLASLGRGVADDLANVLGWLEAEQTRGVVLDLRWCPGGFLDEATGVAGLFLDDSAVIATIRNRGDREQKYHNLQKRRFPKLPVVVLINGQTSGGAELIAAALQDHGRARVAGQRSLGKGTVQTALYVNVPGAHLKLTSGLLMRPSGKSLHREASASGRDDWGVRPEPRLEYRLSPAMSKQLQEWWQAQSLRPGASRKSLPLDDLSRDVQLQVALKAFTR